MRQLAAMIFFLLASFTSAAAHAQIRTVATGRLFTLGTPRINNRGDVAWANPEQVRAEIGGVLTTVAAFNQLAPGTTGRFDVFESASIDDARNVHFNAVLAGTGIVPNVNDRGIWIDVGPTTSLTARTGNQAPGTAAGVSFTSVQGSVGSGESAQLATTSDGRTSFVGIVGGAGVTSANDVGIWSESNGSLKLVAREGDPAPGIGTGVIFDRLETRSQINTQGKSIFRALISGPGVDISNSRGIWLGNSQGLDLVVRTGDPAPGLGANAKIIGPALFPAANQANQVALDSQLRGVPGHTFAMWQGTPGHLQLVTLDRQQVPGAPAGVVTGQLLDPLINAAGAVAFRSIVTGPGVTSANDYSIWNNVGGQVHMLAREGQIPPGLPAGNTFVELSSTMNSSMALNAAGQLAFSALFHTPEGNDSRGIWAQDKFGNLQLIAREGQKLLISPGISKEIYVLYSDFEDTGLTDGRASGFNERGQITFFAGFTDGTAGIFVSNAVQIPEPSTWILAAIGLAGVAGKCVWRTRLKTRPLAAPLP